MKLLPFLLFSKQESMPFPARRQSVHKARLAVLKMYVGAKIKNVSEQVMGKDTAIV